MRLAIVIISIAVLSSACFADPGAFYTVTAELGEYSHYKIGLTLTEYNSRTFSFSITGKPYDINFNASVPCAIKDSVWGKDINCDMAGSYERTTINVEYKTDEKVGRKNNYFIYSDVFIMPVDIDKFSLLVRLPEATGLIRAEDAYTPKEAILGTDGRTFTLYWTKENITKGEDFRVSAAYESIIAFGEGSIEIVLIALITIIILAVVYLKYFGKQKPPINIILPVLKEDEKKIFEALVKHDPGIKQKAIVAESGYSKAKVSKVLTNLQQRGLVKLEREGRTNKVFYDEKFKKKDQNKPGNN